jgi:hypothetical protein
MTTIKSNKLFINKDMRRLMSLSKYKKLIREEMEKMGISLFYIAYSLKHKIKNGIIQN